MAELGRTFAAGVARLLFEVAVSRGADPSALAARSGVDPELFADQDARLPLSSYSALMRAGKELSGDAALGLHFGEAAELSDFSVVGLLGAASGSMLEGFNQLNRFSRLVVDVDAPKSGRFVIERDNGGEFLVDVRRRPNDFFELTESTFARMVSSARRRGSNFATVIHVTHADPGYGAEYARVFNLPVMFESDRNAIGLEKGWLERKFPAQPGYVFGVLLRHADALLNEIDREASWRARLEKTLMPLLHTGNFGIDAISAKLAMSRWTLSRRLKGEGASFEQVLDDLRRRMAESYLDGGKTTISEVAYLTGFSEASAFSRAFKRWTGVSPREFRARRNRP